MNIKYIVGSILAVLALTLAGCDSNPGTFVDKRIKRAKLLNEIFASIDDARLKNEEIDKSVTKELKDKTISDMKRACNSGQKEKLAKAETCFVDRLQEIKDKHDNDAVPMAKIKCYTGFDETKALTGTCINAMHELIMKLDAHTTMQ